ncbi:CbtA family protein [Methyloceanibacter sp.]|uniref:CbtA family protein n=1 Tax=Methyloceanibacter sp. TaxID=1965321 RepID=UPI002D6A374F|nr:CbtA family protein [Methyloceanibacter sp.]HZP09345.1 CbtA family protein [Methyloceanibacter sp.]
MDYFRSIVLVAAIAGILAGLGMTVAQQLTTVPLILKAEVYESEGTPAAHDHGESAQPAAHEHEHGAWQPEDGFERTAFTLLANIVTGVGFALLLIAASELAGGIGNWRQGVFWGLAGFAVFTLAPGLGLPPELPAMPAAELGARQLWWLATVLSTAAGIALLFYGRSPLLIIAALALIAAPHLVGAPAPASYDSPVPEGLHHSFVVAVVLTALMFWVLLGALAGLFRGRLMHAS